MVHTENSLVKTNIFLDTRYNLVLLLLLYIAVYLLLDLSLINDSLYYKSFREQLSYDQISTIVSNKVKFQWLSPILVVTLIFLKLVVVASVIYIGVYLSNYKIQWRSIFGVVILCEYIFLIPIILTIIWFKFISTNYSFNDLQGFFPLSLSSLVKTTDKVWSYPLKTINIFEIIYWFLLGLGIKKVSNLNYESSLGLVIKSYLPTLIIWMVIVMFITISLT